MTWKTAPFGNELAAGPGKGEASTVAATARDTSMGGIQFKNRAHPFHIDLKIMMARQ
jgi:hypothetical protein